MIDTEVPADRAILVSAPIGDIPQKLIDEHLEELGRLADTAGAVVVGTLQQRLRSPHPRTYIGEGKLLELKELVSSSEADLIIFDEELNPAQGKNLETAVSCRVVDRPELILDIFATRARSKEARLQVELAQLEYLLPRLKRMWTHLSRIRGGIGLRGPGETQLETDRRLIGTRIADLKRKLAHVAKARATQRKSRYGQFRCALVGYTNAGKSSLLKALSGSDLFIEDRLFATLDSATRTVELDSSHEALVTDTVGFIRKLPHHLVASFRSTLEEADEADFLLHVVDSSHPDWEEHVEVVDGVLAELGLGEQPQVLVFNKVDKLTHWEEEVFQSRIAALESRRCVFVSAHHPETLGPLRSVLIEGIRAGLREVVVAVPISDGEVLASLYRDGEVLSREDVESEMLISVRLPPASIQQLVGSGRVRLLGSGPGSALAADASAVSEVE